MLQQQTIRFNKYFRFIRKIFDLRSVYFLTNYMYENGKNLLRRVKMLIEEIN